MEPPKTTYDLSILIDMETFKITGEILFDDRLSLWIKAAERIAPRTFELIICSNQPMDQKVELPEGISVLVQPGLGYYGMKNAAVDKAKGSIVFWGDVDCRPVPDYFVNLVRHFDENPEMNILGGRTFYDGEDFATRANSSASWGYLHDVTGLEKGGCYLGHNVAVRRGSLPDYFGPYTERYGGDEYITARHRIAGERLPVFQDMILYHESPVHTVSALLDRQFREIGMQAWANSSNGSISFGQIFRESRKYRRARWQSFKRHAHKFGFKRSEWWKARLLFWYYGLINLVAMLAMLVRPKLLSNWITYQFGDLKKCTPVGQRISQLQNE